ncbi:MAG: hypothetical protein M1829_005038 [Trizodia sp. TS-e1964]|nr:MAG: hypothetical protein M1829_005038 [Trizodia sp. TS-e1964]
MPDAQAASPNAASPRSSTPQQTMPSSAQIQAKFELGVAVALFTWSALTLAVQSEWGGADSASKREWFAGAIVEMFSTRPQTDVEDVETTLLQVMFDEFEVNVDDESAALVADAVMAVRRTTLQGDFALVDEMNRRWVAGRGAGVSGYREVGGAEEEEEESESESDEDGDVEMEEAPALVRAKRADPGPEVDEDGFTKVVGKKRS